MFARLGRAVSTHPWLVIGAWIAAAVALRLIAPSWSQVARDGDLNQLPADCTFSRAAALNDAAFPHERAASQATIVYGRDDGPLTAADRRLIAALIRDVAGLPELPLAGEIWTEQTPVVGSMLRSPSGRGGRLVMPLTTDFMATQNMPALAAVNAAVSRRLATAPAGLELGVTGSAAVGADMLSAMARSLRNTESTTIGLVALVLLAIYRSPWLILIPLATIGLATTAALDLLATAAAAAQQGFLPDRSVQVFTTTRIFVVILLFGSGTDFCLFLIARFAELRRRGLGIAEASAEALTRVGGAIVASALTTMAGLSTMAIADYGKFRASGPAIAVALGVALAVSLTLVPALLATWLGTRVGGTDANVEAEEGVGGERGDAVAPRSAERRWGALADFVLGRPLTVLGLSVAAAAPLVSLGLRAPVTYDLASELSPDAPSRRGAELLEKHFPAGETGPLIVMARTDAGALDGARGRNRIAELAKRLYDLADVAAVRSLYRPTGEPPGAVSLFSRRGLAELALAGSPVAREAFVGRLPATAGGPADVTRLFLVLRASPFSPPALAACDRIEQALTKATADVASPWHGATFELYGPTAGVRDLRRVTLADRSKIELAVTAAVLAIVWLLLRDTATATFLVLSVLAGYLTTLGLSWLICRGIYGPTYPGFDWKAPVFLFVILAAVGQDYNIYLAARVQEEQRRRGPLPGLREAMMRTGGIITSCGVIMAATFASLLTSSLRGMVELGITLSLGILLDTLVVRTLVVPAFLALLAQREETPGAGP